MKDQIGVALPNFKFQHKATIIKMVWGSCKDNHTGEWNRLKS